MGSSSSSTQQQQYAAAAAPRPKNKNEHVRRDPLTHHDIMKQYRKGLTAVVDRCVYIYPTILPMVPLCSENISLLLFWSRLVHADLAMHATLAALGTLPPALCPCEPLRARLATCKPCPMALVPDSTVHCSRPPARNLDLSSSDHAQGPWVGFIYIQLSKLFKNGPGMPLNTRCRAWLDQL